MLRKHPKVVQHVQKYCNKHDEQLFPSSKTLQISIQNNPPSPNGLRFFCYGPRVVYGDYLEKKTLKQRNVFFVCTHNWEGLEPLPLARILLKKILTGSLAVRP